MILYLDTSALVKLFVDEAGSAEIGKAVEASDIVGTSLLAYVEARAAFARRRFEGGLAPADHRRVSRDLDDQWPRFLRIEVTEAIVSEAGDLVEPHRLRAFAALHLASALLMEEQLGEITFACWDHRLNTAARKVGLNSLI